MVSRLGDQLVEVQLERLRGYGWLLRFVVGDAVAFFVEGEIVDLWCVFGVRSRWQCSQIQFEACCWQSRLQALKSWDWVLRLFSLVDS